LFLGTNLENIVNLLNSFNRAKQQIQHQPNYDLPGQNPQHHSPTKKKIFAFVRALIMPYYKCKTIPAVVTHTLRNSLLWIMNNKILNLEKKPVEKKKGLHCFKQTFCENNACSPCGKNEWYSTDRLYFSFDVTILLGKKRTWWPTVVVWCLMFTVFGMGTDCVFGLILFHR